VDDPGGALSDGYETGNHFVGETGYCRRFVLALQHRLRISGANRAALAKNVHGVFAELPSAASALRFMAAPPYCRCPALTGRARSR
jgi:hypothetical protein